MQRTPFVFFDIGSTLMDGPDISPAHRFIAELSLPADKKEMINNFLFTENIVRAEDLVERIRKSFPDLPDFADEIVIRIWDSQCNEGRAVEGAFETIDYLSNLGWELGIISNIWHPYYLCFENLFRDQIHKFKKIILSYQVGHRKPDERIFKTALDGVCKKDEMGNFMDVYSVVIIGDSYYHDILPAMKLGMRTVWLLREYEREANSLRDVVLGKSPMPHLAISDLNELTGAKLEFLKEAFLH